MRSSKSRSRNKPNRNRSSSVGNVVNRVFDSSGPEGKVRGTPQQIIEKYNQLARDAQLSNDRVATENFQQHAEHYLRLLGAAQKEIDAKREQQERENRDRQAERDRQQGDADQQGAPAPQRDSDKGGERPDVQDRGSESDDDNGSTLVETPESKPKRAPRKPRRNPQQDGDANPEEGAQPAPKPRGRKPKASAEPEQDTQPDNTSSDAAAE